MSFFKLRSMKGFTMIELLVVIAIIGIIAVAMLSAINPLEQINRGRDTRERADASELLGALERYYASKEDWPFTPTTSGSTAITIGTLGTVMTALEAADEVKEAFQKRLGAATGVSTDIRYMPANKEEIKVYVCFTPKSTQFKAEAVKSCVDRGTELKNLGVCPSTNAYVAGQAYNGEKVCLP